MIDDVDDVKDDDGDNMMMMASSFRLLAVAVKSPIPSLTYPAPRCLSR